MKYAYFKHDVDEEQEEINPGDDFMVVMYDVNDNLVGNVILTGPEQFANIEETLKNCGYDKVKDYEKSTGDGLQMLLESFIETNTVSHWAAPHLSKEQRHAYIAGASDFAEAVRRELKKPSGSAKLV